jgi:hypothetical protein
MTAAPTCPFADGCTPTTGFTGASPFTPKPTAAANLASLRAGEPPFNANPPAADKPAALERRENMPPTPPAAAPPIAKSP